MSRLGRSDRLQMVLDELLDEANGKFTSAVVTNERGLIITRKVVDGIRDETLAAMVALLSETSKRINNNLELGDARSSFVRADGRQLAVTDFPVKDKMFRLGVLISGERRRRWWRRGLTPEKIDEHLSGAADDIRQILEE